MYRRRVWRPGFLFGMTLIGDRPVEARSPAVHGVVWDTCEGRREKNEKVVTVLVVSALSNKRKKKSVLVAC